MLKIHGHSNSINVRKVLWLCGELNLPYQQKHWGGDGRSLDEPTFRQLNPFGLVPVVEVDGLVLQQSNTILGYLARKNGATSMLPVDPGGCALVEQWMDWQATDLNSAWKYAFSGLVRQNPRFTDPVSIAASVAQWAEQMGHLNQQLASQQRYVCGNQFTLADIGIGLSVNRWFMTPMQRPELPHVTAYYDRLALRPSFLHHGRNGKP